MGRLRKWFLCIFLSRQGKIQAEQNIFFSRPIKKWLSVCIKEDERRRVKAVSAEFFVFVYNALRKGEIDYHTAGSTAFSVKDFCQSIVDSVVEDFHSLDQNGIAHCV